jgi:acetaldehyde dehydrogenase (acetylating)
MIVDSKSFDFGTICASEQAIIADKSIYDIVKRELQNYGAHLLNKEEKKLVEKVMSPILGKINPAIVGRSPSYIAGLAGIQIDDSARLLVAEETGIGKDVPFSMEKLSPVFALYKAESISHAKELCHRLLDLGGRGHSLAIHTENDQVVRDFSLELPVSRILVNTLATIGAVGGTTGLAPSFTLGCGSFGGNITGDNITARHLINIKRVAYGIKEALIPQKGSLKVPVKGMDLEDTTSNIVNSVLSAVGTSTQMNADEISVIVSRVVAQFAK